MKSVLIAKDVTQTTRFNFEENIGIITLTNLLKVFRKDGYKLKSFPMNDLLFKLVNESKRKSIEITSNYISFFPSLEEEEKSEMKKIIYNIIAKRSSVYLTSSEHNLNAAKLALVKGEIRSVASMLYYSLHKFLSGRYYNLLNTKFELSDLEIQITELEHFTSQIFYKSTERFNATNEDISLSNYEDKLKYTSKTINPFLFLLYDLKDINELKLDVNPIIKFLSQKILLIDLEDEGESIIEKIDECINESKRRKVGEKKQERQEREVNAAIAYSLKKLLEKPEESSIWGLFIICLRLYWLRQNADYDYDFEVKTSTREMALLLSYIEKYQKETVEFYEEKKSNRLSEEKGYTKKDLIPQDMDVIEKVKDSTESFFVEFSFPLEIKEEKQIHVYMTALHVDIEFSHEKIISMMNLMSRISNKVKYFTYTAKPGEFELNIHVNEEGRWTFWFDNDFQNQFLLSEYDLAYYYERFINELENVFEKYGSKFSAEFLISQPIILEESRKSLISLKNINIFNKSIVYRKKYLLELLESRLKKMLNLHPYSELTIGNVKLIINLEFQTNESVFSVLPYKDLSISFVNHNKEESDNINAILNFIILDEELMDDMSTKEKSEYSRTFERLTERLMGKLETEDIYYNQFISIEEIEYFDYVNNLEVSDDLLEELQVFFNELSYKLISEGKYIDAMNLLTTIEGKIPYNSYLYATKGMLYLRSNEIDKELAIVEGEKLYQLAIQNWSDTKEEPSTSDFEKKFYIELTRFYIYRHINQEKAEEFLNKAFDIESNEDLNEEAKEIEIEFVSMRENDELL